MFLVVSKTIPTALIIYIAFTCSCFETCSRWSCKEIESKYCDRCQQVKKIRCWEIYQSEKKGIPISCDTKCEDELPCGHKCKGTCSKWYAFVVVKISRDGHNCNIDRALNWFGVHSCRPCKLSLKQIFICSTNGE